MRFVVIVGFGSGAAVSYSIFVDSPRLDGTGAVRRGETDQLNARSARSDDPNALPDDRLLDLLAYWITVVFKRSDDVSQPTTAERAVPIGAPPVSVID